MRGRISRGTPRTLPSHKVYSFDSEASYFTERVPVSMILRLGLKVREIRLECESRESGVPTGDEEKCSVNVLRRLRRVSGRLKGR